jgi:hypothetical protein
MQACETRRAPVGEVRASKFSVGEVIALLPHDAQARLRGRWSSGGGTTPHLLSIKALKRELRATVSF